jgi:uncharacterized protein YjiS (DUF1127 family)
MEEIMHAAVRYPAAVRTAPRFAPLALVETVTAWMRLHAERRALARLDRRLLDDIGVTPMEAGSEAMRPFWDTPAGRL